MGAEKWILIFAALIFLSALWEDRTDVDTVTADVGPDETFDVEVVCHALDVAGESRLA
jgi:hypothetical protein